jgi:very-short-patch-repair endonuclease
MPTFAEYLEKWLKQSTAQGLTNPLVKMPVKRFRLLQPDEFDSLANGGTLIVGTMADPIARNLHKNYQTRTLHAVTALRTVHSLRSASETHVVLKQLTSAYLAVAHESRGFQCLKDFLADLENTQQARTFGIGNKRFERKNDGVSNIVYCESPFEEQVVEFLENEGYDIECQYGAGKFRLDIIIKERGKNILAVECDGAAYHSSLVARTRDRARQRVLEKLGWRIHRVWSTNWWFFEQQEKEGIIAAINSARG